MATEAMAQYFKTREFALDCGTTLPELVVAYQTFGARAHADGRKRRVVLVSTCFGEVVRPFYYVHDGRSSADKMNSSPERVTRWSARAKRSIRRSILSCGSVSWVDLMYVPYHPLGMGS
jgi:hypothetical protein